MTGALTEQESKGKVDSLFLETDVFFLPSDIGATGFPAFGLRDLYQGHHFSSPAQHTPLLRHLDLD